jgi:hypothetical protein
VGGFQDAARTQKFHYKSTVSSFSSGQIRLRVVESLNLAKSMISDVHDPGRFTPRPMIAHKPLSIRRNGN